MTAKKYREGYRIELSKIVGDSKKAVREFLNWVQNNDNMSEYDSEHMITEIAMGCLVYENTTKWYMIKGAMCDFFDKNDITINVFFRVYTFSYSIALAEEDFKDNGSFKTRAEAEEAAFTKAFEILEEKI